MLHAELVERLAQRECQRSRVAGNSAIETKAGVQARCSIDGWRGGAAGLPGSRAWQKIACSGAARVHTPRATRGCRRMLFSEAGRLLCCNLQMECSRQRKLHDYCALRQDDVGCSCSTCPPTLQASFSLRSFHICVYLVGSTQVLMSSPILTSEAAPRKEKRKKGILAYAEKKKGHCSKTPSRERWWMQP